MIEKLTDIKGIGPKKAQQLEKLGIMSPEDLLYYYPRRYIDFTVITPLKEARNHECGAFCACIVKHPSLIRAKGYQIVNCKVDDGTGTAQIVWFNQLYILQLFREGDTVFFFGTPEIQGRTIKFNSPKTYKKDPVIIPVYPSKSGIKQSFIISAVREVMNSCGDDIRETLSQRIIQKYNLMSYHDALFTMHFPQSVEDLQAAKRRIAFEDMLLFRVAVNVIRLNRQKKAGIQFDTKGILSAYKKRLPFELTDGQKSVISDIESDMSAAHAMNRLIQGDVGSGKTAVAMYAMAVAAKNGYQSALLAPTEILAQQHYKTLCNTFNPDTVLLLTGSMTAKQKRIARADIAEGKVLFVIGTHALLQGSVEFSNLGLIICDEQQRFGVEQRAALTEKGNTADVIVMTATPIPRTLALCLYGDMDVSQIHGMPAGRQKVKTRIVPESKRADMYKYLENEAKEGRQAYVVCPQIENEEGIVMNENVTDVYDELKSTLDVSIGLLHGKMKPAEKEKAIADFRTGDIRILVSTTVVEVGVDVPSAVNMVIEKADSFGLSQLHQLRGRIGRGKEAGYCFLVTTKADNERLKALCETTDGFEIAEKDLALRGPGQFLGTEQHGESELYALSLACDMETLESAKEAADELFVAEDEMTEQIVARAMKRFDKGISDT